MATSLDPLAWLRSELARLDDAGLRRRLAVRRGPQSAKVIVDGRELVNFGSNDYLGLASDERLIAAACNAARHEGWGSGASPLVSGRSEAHAHLERRLADFEGAEAALVFPSGFAANAGIIPALVDADDAIFGDAKNHASLIDGCRLTKATRFVYPHCDCAKLDKMLAGAHRFRRRLIVTDSLFSMDGDLAPLSEIAGLAEKFNAMLMVDEAHATGVFGINGRGVVELQEAGCEMLDAGRSSANRASGNQHRPSNIMREEKDSATLHNRVHIRVGTLSKALGSGGGFVCGSQSLIDWLANRARGYVFSTAQPPATSAAASAALDIVAAEPQRREQLLSRAVDLRFRLQAQGWDTGNSQSQIIPIVIGDAERTMCLAGRLREGGYFVPGIRPPSVPEGESLLRISLCYHHSAEMIDGLVNALNSVR